MIKRNTIKLLLLGLIISTSPITVLAEQGDIIVRLRAIGIIPDDDSGLISLNGTELAGSGVDVDEAYTPEIDITYMLTKHIGIEAIAGTAEHTVSLEGPGPALSGLGLTDGFDIFDTWVIPPTISLQYHFMPDSNIRPYAGLGVNYTFFVADDATSALESAVGPVHVSTENGFGWSAQVGIDYDITDKWFINLDVKYIDVDTTATLDTALGSLQVDVDVDPWVIGFGFGTRF